MKCKSCGFDYPGQIDCEDEEVLDPGCPLCKVSKERDQLAAKVVEMGALLESIMRDVRTIAPESQLSIDIERALSCDLPDFLERYEVWVEEETWKKAAAVAHESWDRYGSVNHNPGDCGRWAEKECSRRAAEAWKRAGG